MYTPVPPVVGPNNICVFEVIPEPLIVMPGYIFPKFGEISSLTFRFVVEKFKVLLTRASVAVFNSVSDNALS